MGPRSRMASMEDRRIRRKLIKHLVEKKRRGRINQCLEELRCLVLEAMNRQPDQYEKMEKADILEMTVRYLRHARKTPSVTGPHQAVPPERAAIKTEPGITHNAPSAYQFHSGYRACVHEIAAFLDSYPGVEEGMKQRLLGKLQSKGPESRPPPSAACASSAATPAHLPAAHLPGAHLPSALTPSMDIQCTLSLHPHVSPVSPPGHPFSPASRLPMMSPLTHGQHCSHPYLAFTPIRSSETFSSPEQLTPSVKGSAFRKADGPPSAQGSAQPATPASPMWRPW